MTRKTSHRTIPSPARSSRPRTPTRAQKSDVAAGPVTLTQAQRLAKVRAGAASKAALAAISPAMVGLERRKLERRQERERRTSVKEYTITLTIMKKRGVKGLASTPLQVFAEGDSWFRYPLFPGVITRLERKLGVPILNLAMPGDEVRYMLGVRQRKILIRQFTKGCPAGGAWDAMLFSGGGNDVQGDPLVLLIRDYSENLPPAKLIHQDRLDAVLTLLRAGYEDLIGLRDCFSPRTHLFFHGYDFPIPDGRGACFLGPWLKPTFTLRGFPPTLESRFDVMKILLQQFAAMLKSLETSHARVTFIKSQGTLKPHPSSWHNELHPTEEGFEAFATRFYRELKEAFPNHVL